MSLVDRVLDLLRRYDKLVASVISTISSAPNDELVELRAEKEKLTKELIEHGCRRKY